MPLVTVTNAGLYCPGGGFHIDPRRGVPRAIVTHAHSDHARRGSDQVLVAEPGLPLAAARLGPKGLEGVPYGERRRIGDVEVSLHPAGHVLGSAQVRIECRGEVSVNSGDYKLEADPTCAPFEPLRCHTFLTESTFALPVYRWPAPEDVIEQIQTWWAENRSEGRTSLIFAYSLGKAQRLLSLLHSGPRPIAVHPAMAPLNEAYQAAGVALPEVLVLGEETAAQVRGQGLVIVPPGSGMAWVRRLAPCVTAAASGWMQVRGHRRRQNLDAGFVLSDHADWPGLLAAIAATGAESIGVGHGHVAPLVRYLREKGQEAWVVGDHAAIQEAPTARLDKDD